LLLRNIVGDNGLILLGGAPVDGAYVDGLKRERENAVNPKII
jgi:hypothetical protein